MKMRNKRQLIKEDNIGKRDYRKVSLREEGFDTLDDEIDDAEEGIDEASVDLGPNASRGGSPAMGSPMDIGGDSEVDDVDLQGKQGGLGATGNEFSTHEDPSLEMGGEGGGEGGDVSEMIGMIGYLQDMGMSMSNNNYDVDMLMNKDPEFVKRVYQKVSGEMAESRQRSSYSIGFINQAALTESAEPKERTKLMEADQDIVKYIKKLNIR